MLSPPRRRRACPPRPRPACGPATRVHCPAVRRLAVNLATVASLVTLVAVAALWRRSVSVRDDYAVGLTGDRCVSVGVHPHGLHVTLCRIPDPPPSVTTPFRRALPPPGQTQWARRTVEYGWYTTRWLELCSEPRVRVAGFGYETSEWDGNDYALGGGFNPLGGGWHRVSHVAVPFWALILTIIAMPAGRVARRLRRRPAGRCRGCGYDLRATPDRCPECGAAPPAVRPISPAVNTRRVDVVDRGASPGRAATRRRNPPCAHGGLNGGPGV